MVLYFSEKMAYMLIKTCKNLTSLSLAQKGDYTQNVGFLKKAGGFL